MSVRSYSISAFLTLIFCVSLSHADSRPADRHPDMELLPKAAAQLYDETTFFPRPTKWLRIPWLLDLNEAVQSAKAEKRPVLIWVSGDDPLERC